MKTARETGGQVSSAQLRLKAWEAMKHKYPVNTEWWRDFYLSPGHAENADESQDLIRKAGSEIAAAELRAEWEAAKRAERAEMVSRSTEARDSRRADGLRVLCFNLGNLGVVLLVLYLVWRFTGRDGLPWLDILWALGLVIAPFCYVMAIVFAYRATSLWKKAWSRPE